MSFDDDSFYFEARQVVERNWNNLIDFRLSHRDEIASFLKLHFHDINEIKKKLSWLNIELYFIEFLLNFFNSFNWLTLIRVLIHYFNWNFNLYCCAFLKSFEIRVHASLFLIFKMLFLYCSLMLSCRNFFVNFNDFVWFKSVDNVSYDLNHVN